MNVLFFTCWYPDELHPGSGIFIKEHAKAISAQGINVVVLHFQFKSSDRIYKRRNIISLEDSSLPVHHIIIESCYWKIFYHAIPFTRWILVRYFRKKILKAFKPDVLHSNVLFPAGVIATALARKYDIPMVITEHWSGFEKISMHYLFGKASRNALQKAKRILPVSAFLAGIIDRIIGDSKKVTIIPNIIDERVFNGSGRERLEKSKDTITFLAVANWERRKVNYKRPDIIFESLRRFTKEFNGKVELKIVGNGDLLDIYRENAANYPFQCTFLGFVEKPDLKLHYQQADLFLHASDFETFSVVVAEALSCGTPVIASDIPALHELVDETNGILVNNEPEMWKEAMKIASEIKWNHKMISDSVTGKFSSDRVGRMIGQVYKEIFLDQK